MKKNLILTILIILFSSIYVNVACASVNNSPLFPAIFGRTYNSLTYYHSHTTTRKELVAASMLHPVIEIDLAWAHSAFNPSIKKDALYIGHPEEYYTKLNNKFPEDNVTLNQFLSFLKKNPSVKVLIDIKDQAVFPYLQNLINTIGADRCIVHAFIKNWTHIPEGIKPEPHWYREDVDLFALNNILSLLHVPLIANCRGFSDENIEKNQILKQMIEDSRKCKSVVSLGLYYTEVPLPDFKFLKMMNQNNYYAWINGNIRNLPEKLGTINYIAMSDDLTKCTRF